MRCSNANCDHPACKMLDRIQQTVETKMVGRTYETRADRAARMKRLRRNSSKW